MHVRSIVLLALVLALSGLTGCSGGSSATSLRLGTCATQDETQVLCLVRCTLGCGATGRCERTEIAQNENIVFHFSQDVDPSTVNHSSIQFRTASGEPPVGDFLVRGSTVEFVPQVLVVGVQSFFGFRAGETYTLHMPAGANEPNAIRSTAGDPLGRSVNCSLNVSLGIVDLNGAPPAAFLLTPSTTENVPFDTIIQLEFNEVIDVTPFLTAGSGPGPVEFSLRRTTAGASGGRVCNPITPPTPLPGTTRVDLEPARGVSIVTFRPTQPLPCDICVEITVSDRVRDLSGRPANPQVFQFTTQQVAVSSELTQIEEFDDDSKLDARYSSGEWVGGLGTFGNIGGEGQHGEYDVATLATYLGNIGGKETYLLNTDSTTVPGTSTLSGDPITITDGRFNFTRMVVTRDQRLRFTGSSPPQFTVRGEIEIAGIIELMGEDRPIFIDPQPTGGPTPGQAGGAAGIFGGAGGRGGERCQGTGASPTMSGQDGLDLKVRGGHAYAAQTINTRGRGSSLFPASGLTADLIFSSTLFGFCFQSSAGGGGGGFTVPGGEGRVISNTVVDPITGVPPRFDFMGPPAAGGNAFALFPVPAGARSSLHFLVGGAGGGGSASGAVFSNNVTRVWAPGSGGGGGGGAAAFRSGSVLRVTTDGRILANGGNCSSDTVGTANAAVPVPGGGGTGGTVLFQTSDRADIQGFVDVRGGVGGYLNRATSSAPPVGGRVEVRGGSGANGFLRLEVPRDPLPTLLPNVQPAATAENVALLTESDPRSGFQSKFYSTGQAFGPTYVRYEMRVLINGTPFVFSDDPARGTPARFSVGSAVQVWFQGGTVDLFTNEATSLRPWREFVGQGRGGLSLADDSPNGFRFLILVDRSAGQQVEIDWVKVVYRFC